MKICLRFVTKRAATEAETDAGEEQQFRSWSWACSDFLLGFVFPTFHSLRSARFVRSFRFAVCCLHTKTFFHMHLSAKACHTVLPPAAHPSVKPYSTLRLSSTLVPCRWWRNATLFAVFHKILNIPFFLLQLILWGSVQDQVQSLQFSFPLTPTYPLLTSLQSQPAALGHSERLIIWQLVCQVRL